MSSTVGITYKPPESSSSMIENITYLNWTTREPYERPFTDTSIIGLAVVLLAFLVFGLIGNILTIVVITTNPKLKNIFMCFIVSLCVSDLWSATISWLFLYGRTWGYDVWSPLPSIFCRFYWASDLMTNYVTAWHILSFASLRYLSCQFPITFSKIKLKHAKVLIPTIWILSFLNGFIPFFIFFGEQSIDRDSNEPNVRWSACTLALEWLEVYVTYQKFAFPVLFYAPTVAMIALSILLSVSVWKRSKILKTGKNGQRERRKERQAVLQVCLIVMSYLFGYIPFTVYEFWALQPLPNTKYNIQVDYWYGTIQYYFLRFSECLNPIFYNLGSSKMRHYTKKFLKEKLCCCCCLESKTVSTTSSTSGTTAFKTKTQAITRVSSDNELLE